MNATTTLNIHDTDPGLYDALARVFPKTENDEFEWITLAVDGVSLTFFKTSQPAVASEEVPS